MLVIIFPKSRALKCTPLKGRGLINLLIKKFLLMRLTTILLLLAFLNVKANSYSQKVTLSEKNASLEKIFSELSRQTNYKFVYTKAEIDKGIKIDLNVKGRDIRDVLEICSKGQPFGYTIFEDYVVIKYKPVSPNTIAPIEAPAMKELKGRVVNESGEPLPNATVQVKGGKKSTVTNANGYFSIEVEDNKPATLIISYVGMETLEIKVDGGSGDVNVQLKAAKSSLSDIVVVGYGTSRKKDITGSVSSVPIAEQEKAPVLGVEQMLSGRASGVEVTQNQAQPGALFTIRIRGTNSINASSAPLFVVDGYAGGDISNLNPSDVLSIDVLKDASATAIYGSRGANGVIIITTKRGNLSGPKVIIDAYTGIQFVSKRYDMMDAKQYATYLNTIKTEQNAIDGTNNPLPFTQDQISKLGKGTDWQDAIFQKAPISNISLAFNGGDENTKHYLSFNYFNQDGIIIKSNYKKGSIRYNLDQKLGNRLKMGLSSQLGYALANNVTVNTDATIENSVLWDAVRFNPMIPVQNPDGTYPDNGPLGQVVPMGNPVGFVNRAKDERYSFTVAANVFGELEIIKGLRLRSSFGVNYGNDGRELFIPTGVFSARRVGRAEKSSGQSYNWLNENTLTYDKTFNAIHTINVTGGFTAQYWHNKWFNAAIINLTTDLLDANNFDIGLADVPGSSFQDNFLASYFARANYRLMDKYLLTLTMRADGSSRFGQNDKWGYFPSGAIAWHLSEENFIRNIKAISDMKLRISYGITGNQEIGSYNSLSQYSFNTYELGSVPVLVTGAYPANIANPDLKWESTASTDIGLDIGLLNNRINITADYYDKKTSNLLLYVDLPRTSGYRSILLNTGKVSNKGFELTVSSLNINRSNFRWNTTLVFSTNKNEVVNLGVNKQLYVGHLSGSLFNGQSPTSSILIPGSPIGSFYGIVFDGVWQSEDEITKSGTTDPVHPGDPKYRDLNGDHKISGEDRMIIGQARPKFTYGLINNFSLGRLNLNIHLQGVNGNRILNENLWEIQNGQPYHNKLAYVATDSWHGEGTSNTLPRVSSSLRTNYGLPSDVLENGSYLRIKTVTLSYDAPLPKYLSVFKSSTVYVTAQNLHVFTKYSGYDPEVNSFGEENALTLGTDYNAYPNYRTFLIGVKFHF